MTVGVERASCAEVRLLPVGDGVDRHLDVTRLCRRRVRRSIDQTRRRRHHRNVLATATAATSRPHAASTSASAATTHPVL